MISDPAGRSNRMSGPLASAHRDGPVVLVSKEIEYTFPLSYAYLAGYLREMGEDVRILFRPRATQHTMTIQRSTRNRSRYRCS